MHRVLREVHICILTNRSHGRSAKYKRSVTYAHIAVYSANRALPTENASFLYGHEHQYQVIILPTCRCEKGYRALLIAKSREAGQAVIAVNDGAVFHGDTIVGGLRRASKRKAMDALNHRLMSLVGYLSRKSFGHMCQGVANLRMLTLCRYGWPQRRRYLRHQVQERSHYDSCQTSRWNNFEGDDQDRRYQENSSGMWCDSFERKRYYVL